MIKIDNYEYNIQKQYDIIKNKLYYIKKECWLLTIYL